MRIVAIGAGVVAVLGLLFVAVPRDPMDRFPGTRLTGDISTEREPDWSFLEGNNLIFVEVTPWYGLPHSVTTTSWIADGELYVPCRSCNQKHWASVVDANPRVRVEIHGTLYERTAIRITDDAARRRLLRVPSDESLPDVDVFRMASPTI